MGQVRLEDVAEHRKSNLEEVEGLAFVDLEESPDSLGHGYFHASPEASSDLIMTIRYGLKPGKEGGRPLTPLGLVFWRLEAGYPYSSQHED